MKRNLKLFSLLCLLAITLVADSGTYPDPKLTPGDLLKDAKGNPAGRPIGSTRTIRNVPEAEANAVFAAYKIPPEHQNGADYEIDHFISLVLGGSNDPKNLWPQTRDRNVEWNAWEKDRIEDKLYHLVSAGDVPFEEAQQAIRKDWVLAYEKYMPMTIRGKPDYVIDPAVTAQWQQKAKDPTTPPTLAKLPHVHYISIHKADEDPDEK